MVSGAASPGFRTRPFQGGAPAARTRLWGASLLAGALALGPAGSEEAPQGAGAAATEVASVSQGWPTRTRAAWYRATQGSRLMPNAWCGALERAENRGKFAEIDHLTRFGFIAPNAASGGTLPLGLPRISRPKRSSA